MAIKTLITTENIRKYEEAGFWGHETILEYLLRNSERHPDREAFINESTRVSFGELWNKTSRLARAFSAIGIKKETIVAVQLPNCADFIYAYYALSLIGAIILPIHMPYRKKELLDIIDRYDVQHLIGPDNFRDFDHLSMYTEIREACQGALEVIIVGQSGSGDFLSFDELLSRTADAFEFDREKALAAANEVNAIFLTSGTTGGKIKGVMWTINMFTHNAKAFNESYQVSYGDRTMYLGPFTHVAFVLALNSVTYLASTLLTVRDMDLRKAIEMIAQERVTTLLAVPAQYSRMMDYEDYKRRDTSSLRTLVSFGSAVPAELVKRVRKEMCPFNLWYGTTEGGYCTTKWGLPLKTLQETVGSPQRGAEWQVVDQQGNPLPAGIEGELCINGPVRSAGYYNDEELNKISFDDQGWFHTGDLGFVDEDGNVHVTGRIKDLIIRGGENILPIEIENEIFEHPKVKDVAVIGMPDLDLGEKVCAYVECVAGENLTLEEIREFLQRKGLAYFKLPERLEIIDDIPSDRFGKDTEVRVEKRYRKKA